MQIILTGGGSGGHTVPAMALADALLAAGHPLTYLGSENGMERTLAGLRGIPYVPIQTGKLRRYFDIQNFTDPFRVLVGFFTAYRFFRKQDRHRTRLVAFGGFVSLPVVWAAFFARIPSYLHEQTSRAGLANRLCAPVVRGIAISFEASRKYYPARKTTFTGYPLRPDFMSPEIKAVTLSGRTFEPDGNRKLILVTGGGNGSQLINQWVSKHVTGIPEGWVVIHQTGSRWFPEYQSLKTDRYVPIGQITQGMADLLKMAHGVITRGGAGILSEIGHLRRPAVVVPLAHAQGNEQYHNAMEISRRSPMVLLEEPDLLVKNPWDSIQLAVSTEKNLDSDDAFSHPAGTALERLVSLILA